jgi:hypothetical protein
VTIASDPLTRPPASTVPPVLAHGAVLCMAWEANDKLPRYGWAVLDLNDGSVWAWAEDYALATALAERLREGANGLRLTLSSCAPDGPEPGSVPIERYDEWTLRCQANGKVHRAIGLLREATTAHTRGAYHVTRERVEHASELLAEALEVQP